MSNSESDVVLCEEQEGVAVVTLNRPQALNAFNDAMRNALLETLRRLAEVAWVRAIVLTGAGRGFNAGADLREFTADASQVDRQLAGQYHPGVRAIIDCPKPVIAAVEGFVSGIGAAYVLASDLVVMSEAAFMHLPFQTIALIPDGGLCWQLARAVGHQRAFEMAVDSQRWSAERCRELGLVNRVVPAGTALAEARSWAARLAAGSAPAIAALKRSLRAAAAQSLDESLALETQLQRSCVLNPDFGEGLRAFFEKRPPQFRR